MGLRYSTILVILPILSVLIFAFLFIIRRRSQKIYFFSNMKILKRIKKRLDFNPIKKILSIILIILLITISLLLTVLTARPYEKREFRNVKSGIDIMISLDASLSMDEDDFQPQRFEAAKSAISEFVSRIENDRVGLVIFRGQSYTLSPLTFDYSIIDYYLEDLAVDFIPTGGGYGRLGPDDTIEEYIKESGTAIGDGIVSATLKFQDDEERTKVIILITDGITDRGYDTVKAAEYARSKNVKIYSIYIGNPNDNETFGTGTYGQGLDTLKEVSKITGGNTYSAENEKVLNEVLADISDLEKTDIEIETNVIKADTPMPMIIFTSLLASFYLIFKSIIS